MRTLLYLIIVTIGVAEVASCSRPKSVSGPLSTQMSIATGTDTHIVAVQYGYMKDGTVGYIAFTARKKPQKVSAIVTMTSDSMGSHKAYLTKPNGEIITLPSDKQLFECIDGRYAESEEKVDKEVFEAFLASKPKEYTIKALLAFAEKKKASRARGQK